MHRRLILMWLSGWNCRRRRPSHYVDLVQTPTLSSVAMTTPSAAATTILSQRDKWVTVIQARRRRRRLKTRVAARQTARDGCWERRRRRRRRRGNVAWRRDGDQACGELVTVCAKPSNDASNNYSCATTTSPRYNNNFSLHCSASILPRLTDGNAQLVTKCFHNKQRRSCRLPGNCLIFDNVYIYIYTFVVRCSRVSWSDHVNSVASYSHIAGIMRFGDLTSRWENSCKYISHISLAL